MVRQAESVRVVTTRRVRIACRRMEIFLSGDADPSEGLMSLPSQKGATGERKVNASLCRFRTAE
jgi:hypothetical protein